MNLLRANRPRSINEVPPLTDTSGIGENESLNKQENNFGLEDLTRPVLNSKEIKHKKETVEWKNKGVQNSFTSDN